MEGRKERRANRQIRKDLLYMMIIARDNVMMLIVNMVMLVVLENTTLILTIIS